MKKREIRVWMAAVALALGMGLTACGADSVDTGAKSSAAEGSNTEDTTAGSAAKEESNAAGGGTEEGSKAADGSEGESSAAEGSTEEGSAETGQESADDAVLLEEGTVEDGVYEGIVVDASMNNFAIRTEEGVTYFMERPEQGEDLKDGLLLGIPVKAVIKDRAVIELTDGEKQPQSGQETLNFAVSVMDAFRYEDMGALTTLMKYPASVVLEGDMVYEVEDAEQMEEIGAEKIFTEELKKAVRSVNLYELKAAEDGSFVMGQAEGGCRVVFEADADNDRGFSIRSIEGPLKTNAAG